MVSLVIHAARPVRVLATLGRFLRAGLPWRSLHATAEPVSGSTLRRFLAHWAENAVLAKVHALLVAMLRGHPILILDSCSVRAERGADTAGWLSTRSVGCWRTSASACDTTGAATSFNPCCRPD